MPRASSRRLLLLVAFWGAFTLLVDAHTYLVLRLQGVPMTTPTLVASTLHGLSWIALTPIAVFLARRFPLDAQRWPRSILVHAGAALALNLVAVVAIVGIAGLFDTEPVPFGAAFTFTLLSSFFFFLLLYAAVVAAVHAAEHARRARERAVQATRLEAQLAHAQLNTLRSQLNPHFLFNTLHAVSTLMARDVPTARRVLADLSSLLRLSLEKLEENEATLEEEMDFLRHYLQIEQTRFADRLAVRMCVAPEAQAALLPTLLLQPLVENALKHGIAPRVAGGCVEITARRQGDALVLTVSDDGPGLREAEPARGIGLQNTRERLARLYGAAQSLTLTSAAGSGLTVEVRLPFHTRPLQT